MGDTSLSRRRALGVAGAAVLSAACGERGSGGGHRFHDDVTRAGDGPLEGRLAPTGHRWNATSISGPAPVIRDGAVGPPAGYVPAADGSPDAGYASITLDRPVTTVGADVRWDRSDDVASGLALGAFTHVPGPGSVLGARGGSPLHLGVAPALVLFSVFSRGIDDYETLTPEGMDPRSQGAVAIPGPLVQDGRTLHRVEAVIDRRASSVSVTVPGLPTLYYRDRRLGAVDARVAFWEFYTVPGSTNVPRFTRMWAD